jgi:hypothetical protein
VDEFLTVLLDKVECCVFCHIGFVI